MDSDSKTAEFARLFNFFERLASHKSSSHNDEDNNTPSADDIDSIPLSTDLAPVIHSLASLIRTRSSNAGIRQQKSGGRKRSYTIATTSRDTHNDDNDDESLAKFPLERKYHFTFRLMLHKLYQMDDWKQKVKEVLERSKMDYKPLSETSVVAGKKVEEQGQEQEKLDGRVHFKAGVAGDSRKTTVRPRAHSVLLIGKAKDTRPTSPPLRSPVTTSRKSAEEARAVKKRCVGSRKSLSGPLGTEAGGIGRSWVYDAAVSSVEVSQRDNEPGRQGNMDLLGYASLGVAGPGKATGRRRVSLGAPGTQNLDGAVVNRTVLSVMNNVTPVQAQRKRPLEL